ncbi:3-hydroxypropanoate dehydrogenase [Sphingobium sp. AP50]|uniref:malonic semialdehyde reductase n=1 Tax=Sphingobium sp. AP50 TaxID=1884369 RepID=UPI0008D787D3|nr:malonic semialdehyde reductase [Sphingobium sp. AP50]SEI55710.1 3-hydroxypropanoate dehydrogenase [Sphingobium sp. AP50]
MTRIDDKGLDLLFRTARSHNGWSDRDVGDELIREVYDLARLGPTSANTSPARFIWVRGNEARLRLAACAMGPNAAKILSAPVTVIVARDLGFVRNMPVLFPHAPHMHDMMADPRFGVPTAVRNTTLQGAYLLLAARALGLDCGPMSGFDPVKVKDAFFADEDLEADFICSMGFGNGEGMFERLPRLAFDEANRIA